MPKLFGVYPLARRYAAPHGVFTTLLMSTGLTFGTISSLYGLNAGIINKTQFSLLITVVVLSANIPNRDSPSASFSRTQCPKPNLSSRALVPAPTQKRPERHRVGS